MLTKTTAQQEALEAGHAKRRIFISADTIDPDTGETVQVGFWDDLHTVKYLADLPRFRKCGLSQHHRRTGDLTIPGLTVTDQRHRSEHRWKWSIGEDIEQPDRSTSVSTTPLPD